MWMQDSQKMPTTSKEAADIGYEHGKTLRENGAKPEALEFNIDTYKGSYPRSPYYSDWLRGFRAGYLGERKPLA